MSYQLTSSVILGNVPPLYVSAANLSAGGGAGAERPFVRAASLLHSHFCATETLQEAIIRLAPQRGGGARSVTVLHPTGVT